MLRICVRRTSATALTLTNHPRSVVRRIGEVAQFKIELRKNERILLRKETPLLLQCPENWPKEQNLGTVEDPFFLANLPPINVVEGPKGMDDMLEEGTHNFVFEYQRLKYAAEYVEALTSRKRYGVLFSGPNGVGKSAICLTTFLFCFARGLPVVYIPKADLWVRRSRTEADAGIYFMEEFFDQNADIIAESSDLAPFFADQLNDQPVSGDAYVKFAKALRSRSMPRCGMIVDEAQKLIESASEQPQTTRDGEVILKKDGSPLMKNFFAADFTVWTSYSGSFCSQLCASSHGLREFTLPSGESHRLRFVTPFSPNTGRSLLQREDSPFFVKPEDGDADGQALAVNMEAATGWMPRPMQQAAEECRKKGSKVGMDNFKFVHYAVMRDLSDKKWLSVLPTDKHITALNRIPDLILGKISFNPLEKQLYDHGVLFVNESGHFQPVSNLAADMLFRMHVEETQTNADPEDPFYWRDVEIAVEKAISYSWGKSVPVLSLDGKKTMIIPFGANELKLFVGGTFAGASECIVQDEKNTILYIPRDSQFTCDMFLLPPVGSEDPIVVIDVSIADPYSTDRIKKYKRWQELTVIPRLKEKFPSHDVVCVAVWPQQWTAEKAQAKILNNFSPENKDALMATYLMDKTGMNNVNIAIKYKD